ncbi:MAG: type II toxin-antitoxin system HicA family toxin [Pirellulaceae bacterium]|nr:type II toxin-antitoxin system HicA family toxin [Pirellulaceae bacterium]
MPPFGPISRKESIRALRVAGFDGPYSGSKHSFMLKGNIALTVPNIHKGDIGKNLLARILQQAGISREQWERPN